VSGRERNGEERQGRGGGVDRNRSLLVAMHGPCRKKQRLYECAHGGVYSDEGGGI
jgi:hypothetical protein